MVKDNPITAEEFVAQKSISRSTIQACLADVDRQIFELNIQKKTYLALLKERDGDLTVSKPRKKREGSGYRRALGVLANYPGGLTVVQLHEKAVQAGIDIKYETLSSQISKGSGRTPAEVRRIEDGKYVVV